jgi:hypothetical protein
MAGVVHIPWYSTGLRSDKLADALAQIAPVSVRYGATSYAVHRSRDDRHKFLQMVEFETKLEWERYWTSPEFTDWRVIHSGWFQIPTLYVWNDIVVEGRTEPEDAANAEWAPENATPAPVAAESAATA